jgi:hypothetical protein
VDPVPAGGGLLNVNNAIGFDSKQRPILTYHKNDAAGHTQAYTARFEEGAWKLRPASAWTTRWNFSGGGSIEPEIRLGGISSAGPGRLAISYQHKQEGSGRLVLDEATLEPVKADAARPVAAAPATKPRDDGVSRSVARLRQVEGKAEGLQVHLQTMGGPDGATWVLRWESLGPNRDRPRTGPLPEASPLQLYVIP